MQIVERSRYFTTVVRDNGQVDHIVHLEPTRYEDDADHWGTPDRGFEIRIQRPDVNPLCRYSILFIGPNGSGRTEFKGEVLPGPHAWLIGLASVISTAPQARAQELVVAEGARLILNGIAYEINARPNGLPARFDTHNPVLTRVSIPAAVS